MKLGIVDYGAGNIYSLEKAFWHIGVETVVTSEKQVLRSCSGIVLPGVAAFNDAAARICEYDLADTLREQVKKGKLLLGICLGMQLFYEESEEGDSFQKPKGLALLKGSVLRLPEGLKVPHMGWNTLEIKNQGSALKGIENGAFGYFVHSYYAEMPEAESVSATTDYGVPVPAVIEKDNLVGMQFHPEKSGETGLKILKNIKEMLV